MRLEFAAIALFFAGAVSGATGLALPLIAGPIFILLYSPPQAVMLLMDGVSRFMLEEDAYGLSLGHEQAVAVVERQISEVEGPRRGRRARERR